jgi:hypothetical protein
MATATKKSSAPADADLPDVPADFVPASERPGAAPAARAAVPGCGTPNCSGTKAYAPGALTVTANVATGRTRVLTAAAPAGKCLPKNIVWDFGDGDRVVGPSPMTHTFAGTGTSFSVVAKPQTSTGTKASAPLAVTIT